jgi:hypothetical protein
MLGLPFEHDDVIPVAGNLYCKTPEALKALLAVLPNLGYEVKNNREDEYNLKRTTVEQMEKNGWSLWYASLRDIRFAKCDHCKQYISTVGTRYHGHTCEKCGEIIYLEHVNGSSITFRFNPETPEYERAMFSPRLRGKVHKWDTEEGYLYIYLDTLEPSGLLTSNEIKQAYLAAHANQYELVNDTSYKSMKVRYPHPWNRDVAAIEPTDSYGHVQYCSIVKVWNGKEYSEWEQLPIPESMSIYEAWHWAPLPVSPTLHKKLLSAVGQTDDKGWHYQDGSPWFKSGTWKEMAKFVRHFTQLDADAFDRAWPRFRADGPGGIDDVARFCHHNAEVRDEPNIGNTLVAYGKLMSGQSLTREEIEAAKRGEKEDDMGFFKALRKQSS